MKYSIYSLLFFLLYPCILTHAQTEENSDTTLAGGKIFLKVEIEAAFPGGDMAWRQFLQKNLNPNVPVDNGAPMGLYTVMVQFVVDRDGNVSDVVPLTNMGYGMEQEVVRIIKKSGAWVPAVQFGRPVKAYRKQPVTFQVIEDGIEISTATPFVLFAETENEMTVSVRKVKSEDIELTVPGGKVVPLGNGKFKVTIKKTGRVQLQIFNRKKEKLITTASFEVR